MLGGWLLAGSREFAGWAELTATYTDLAAEDGLISGRWWDRRIGLGGGG